MKKKIIVVFLIIFSLGANRVYSASNYKGMLNESGEIINDSLKCGEAYYWGKMVNYYRPSSNESYCCPSADSVVSSRTTTISVDDLFKLDDDNMALLKIINNNNNNTCSYELYKKIDDSKTSIVINEDTKLADLDNKETKYIYALPTSAPLKYDEFKEGCYYDEVQLKYVYGKYKVQQYNISQPDKIKNYNKSQCLGEEFEQLTPDTNNGGDGQDDNVEENPKTGSILFFLALIIGFSALGYSIYYFKNREKFTV